MEPLIAAFILIGALTVGGKAADPGAARPSSDPVAIATLGDVEAKAVQACDNQDPSQRDLTVSYTNWMTPASTAAEVSDE